MASPSPWLNIYPAYCLSGSCAFFPFRSGESVSLCALNCQGSCPFCRVPSSTCCRSLVSCIAFPFYQGSFLLCGAYPLQSIPFLSFVRLWIIIFGVKRLNCAFWGRLRLDWSRKNHRCLVFALKKCYLTGVDDGSAFACFSVLTSFLVFPKPFTVRIAWVIWPAGHAPSLRCAAAPSATSC